MIDVPDSQDYSDTEVGYTLLNHQNDKLSEDLSQIDSSRNKSQDVLEYEERLKKESQLMKEIAAESNTKSNTSDADERSIHVGSVHFGVKIEELQSHFEGCGKIIRATILQDKYTQKPKGFAYVEFENAECVQRALELNETQLHGRIIKVQPKRTNIPGFSKSRNQMAYRHSRDVVYIPVYRGGRRGRSSGGRFRGYGALPY